MRKVALLLAIVLSPISVLAQNAGLGIPSFGSFSGGDFDTVDNQNVNIAFSIPLVSSPGRGMPLNLSLTYNSLVWQKGSSWTPATDAYGNPTWGWTKDFPAVRVQTYTIAPENATLKNSLAVNSAAGGTVAYTSTTLQRKCTDPGYPILSYDTIYKNFSYYDVLGTSHSFSTITITVNPNCPSHNYGTYSSYADDATGYFLNDSSANPTAPILTAPDGKTIINGSSGTSSDSNGNYITKTVVSSTETDWTDSVGNTALKIIYSPSQSAPTQIQYEFLDGTGASNYQTITLKLQSYNIKTVFNCSGVGEYNGTANLPYELDIPSPNGGSTKLVYTFIYEGTPNNSGYYTGRLLKATLPAGGSYEYDYPQTGSPYGINCADGTTVNVNRKVSDGTNSATWNYVRNVSTYTTTMTTPVLPDTPNANDTIYTFNSTSQETSRQIYGNSPGTTLLRTINTTWATNSTPATQITILEDSNHTQSKVATTYDSNGLLDSVTEYDWGQGAPGTTIRTTNYTYNTSTNYTSRNIINLVTSKQITNGQQGTVLYRQDTVYDGVALASCPTGVPQHFDSAYPCTMNYRGNPTQVTAYLSPNTPSNGISKNFTYDWFGNVLSAQVNCCQNQSWTYSSTTQYSRPVSTTIGTSPSPQLTTTYTYNAYTGLLLTATDPNGLVTNSSYDFLHRPTRVWQTIGSTIGESLANSYDDIHFTNTTTTTVDSSKSVQQIGAMDGLGRTIKSTTEDSSNNIYSIVSPQYDMIGRAYKTSNPYTGSPSNWTTTQFDVLGRPILVTLPDNSTTTYAYATNTATVTDPTGKKRESVADAAGRLATVYEPDPSNGNSLTLQTTNTYNVVDELTQVTQGSQTRTYNYDALGRLLSESFPESGTTCFGSVSGSTCDADGYDQWDNLLKRTDARGVFTSYTYDGLNRLIGVAYTIPNGSGVSAMPNVCDPLGGNNISARACFAYGASAASYNNGRQITITDAVGSENYAYNNLGQMTQLQKKINGTTYTTNYQYNVSGELTQITYPSGRVVQQSVDAIGRLCEVAPSTTGCGTASTPFATGYGYNTANEVTGLKYGNGIYASLGFSADRLQMNCLDYSTTNRNGSCAHDSTTKFGLNYSYGTSGSNDGQISAIADSVDNGRSATYTYDALARLSTAVTTGSTNYPKWGLSFTYDRYGNRWAETQTAGSPPNNSVAVSATTNQITTSGYTYDLSGNMTNDGYNALVYDGENRATSATNGSAAGTYTYDGNGIRVQKAIHNGTTTVYVFSAGRVIAEYENGALPSAPTREYIYNGGELAAKIEGSNTSYYHQDSLSTRLMTDSSGNKIGEQGHFPYGETWYLNNTTTKWEFTTYERDTESGNDYAFARDYVNRLGRFSVADPVEGSSADPQSLDRYNYVEDDPINTSDPSGLCPKWGPYWTPYAIAHPVNGVVYGGRCRPTSFSFPFFDDGSGGIIGSCLEGGRCDNSLVIIPGGPIYIGSGDPPTTGPTIGPDPDWSHSKQVQCLGPGGKAAIADFLGGKVLAPVVLPIASAISQGSFAPLADLFSGGNAADAAERGAGYIANNRGAVIAIRGAARGAGIRVSGNSIARDASLFGKAAKAFGAALSIKAGYDAYKACTNN